MSEEQWDPTTDEDRRADDRRAVPRRESDRIRAESPGGWKLDIMGPSIQTLQLALLFVIAYAVLWVIGPILLRYGDNLLHLSNTMAIATCTNVEHDQAKLRDRYEECRRGFGR